jgi:outer membrane lipoprotein-sorting protein
VSLDRPYGGRAILRPGGTAQGGTFMPLRKTLSWLPAVLACTALLGITLTETLLAAPPEASPVAAAQPRYQLAERSEAAAKATSVAPLGPGDANEHQLMPVLRWAYSGLGNVEKIQDYSATLAKRERIGGKVRDYEYMFLKLRQRPFSVYMSFLGPQELRGREVIYVEGQNGGNMWAHGVGLENTMFGTVSLKPDGPVAMRNQRYPVTELGILNLTRRLVEVGEQDVKYGECDVKYYKGVKVQGRVCTCIEVVHPQPRRNFRFHLARIFVDDELNLPIRYESYDWPEKGRKMDLMEEYTYTNLKLNVGFTDADFDYRNPKYHFR